MRELGAPINDGKRHQIAAVAKGLFDAVGAKRAARASEFELELPGDPVVVKEADIRFPEGRLRVAMTTPQAHPHFEWLIEITSNIGETDYFKHYLVLENDVVLAQRKVLTPIDLKEADVILADLASAQAAL